MRKLKFAVPVIVAGALALGALYSVQPDRMTPERVRQALAAEEALRSVDEAEAEIVARLNAGDGEDAASGDRVQVALAETEENASDESQPEEKKVPDTFKVKFECSNGDFVAEFHKEWSEAGAERVYELVESKFFDNARFFRVIGGFMAQFGLAADPAVTAKWRDANLPEEQVKKSNTRGMISFAMAGGPSRPGYTNQTRTTQLFISYGDNSRLDGMGFAPVGQVVEGMDVVDKLYNGYGEGAPSGRGPSQGMIQELGNPYLEERFPQLDFIKRATIVKE